MEDIWKNVERRWRKLEEIEDSARARGGHVKGGGCEAQVVELEDTWRKVVHR